ncbi:MAG: long-chain-fatty-acid--CoA ligase [Deltaproteobacteria bacterium]|nr:long-chain-fatty-acid--CoA ligase [Deltaproteobacteria bacterium]
MSPPSRQAAPSRQEAPHSPVWSDPLTPVVSLERTLRVFPERTAVAYGDQRWTYAEFALQVGIMGAALRRAGVGPGDRVAVLAPNTPWNLAAAFACPLIQAPLVTINTRLAAAEVAYILDHSGARVILVDPELAPLLDGIRGELTALERVVEIPDDTVGGTFAAREGEETWEQFSAGVEPLPISNPLASVEDENALLSINYTSGTTGRPKGVMYSHRGAYLNALGEVGALGLAKETTFLWTLPLFHCNGWCMPWAVTAAGGKHVCLRAIDPPEVLRLIEEQGVTHFNGAPTVLLMLSSDPAAQGMHFDPPLRVCTGGAPPSPTLLEAMEKLGIRITHLYGLTETYGPHVLCEMQSEWENLDTAARARVMSRQGVPFPHAVYLRVVDDEMLDVPADGETMGEVVMRGNNTMMGYYRDEEATAHAFRGGWFHSGDIGVMHGDGYIELRDRSKDIIISGGENISTIEVENTLYQHPDVQEVAVIGVPHEKWGEVPKAFVVPRPGASPTEEGVIAFARERLAHFKCPKSVEFGELPKTATGKIQKFKLRDKEWTGHGSRIQG